MNEFNLLPDDPKLTAFALGELEGPEHAKMEQALQSNPAAQQVVAEIRAMAVQLKIGLATEPVVAAVARTSAADTVRPLSRRNVRRFPHLYYVIGGLAAACFAVVLALHETPPAKRSAPHYFAVAMPVAESAANEAAVPAEGTTPLSAGAVEPVEPRLTGVPPSAVAEIPLFDAKLAGWSGQLSSLTQVAPDPVRSITSRYDAGITASGSNDKKWAAEAQRPRQPTGAERMSDRSTDTAVVVQMKGVGQSQLPKRDAVASKNEIIVLSAFNVSSSLVSDDAARGLSAGSRRLAASEDAYAYRPESDFIRVTDQPLSTFSADVDTASYANVRQMLATGQRPPVDAVRIEEMLNYFPYPYPGPPKDQPFSATMEVAEAPWREGHRLVRIGLKARDVTLTERGAANLVFLLDVSGSMNAPQRLPLVKESMRLLLGRLRPDDRVAIVTYAGSSGLALPSTAVVQKAEILAALEELHAAGSTHGSRGIELAYEIAQANFVSGGVNRVILCTDGDFNVGVTSEGELVRLIKEKAKTGVFLTVLGFGRGNLKDSTMQQLADSGNGNYGYVDSRREAEKLLIEQVSGTLVTVAKDVKLQVEFNPAQVASYRLIGYEKRALNQEDFANDKVDAGELGAGHTVTALYEIVPVAFAAAAKPVDREEPELRYGVVAGAPTAARRVRPQFANELLTLRIRYKDPSGILSKKLEFSLVDSGARFESASPDFKFVSAVAAFGMLLRSSEHRGNASYASVASWAEAGAAHDTGGYRAEFISLVRGMQSLE